MTDLHKLLYEPWMETDASHNQFERRAALATRMPKAVPVGLEWEYERWYADTPNDGKNFITDEQAELLFIGNAVGVLTADHDSELIVSDEGVTLDDNAGRTFHHMPLPAALAAALHRLADERDAEKETP